MALILDKELQKEIDEGIRKHELIDQLEPKETLKLVKNTKGYNWEIKIFPKEMQTDFDWMKRLEELNNQMINKFENTE